jgi:uncharacterized protein (UPF0335 family)
VQLASQSGDDSSVFQESEASSNDMKVLQSSLKRRKVSKDKAHTSKTAEQRALELLDQEF